LFDGKKVQKQNQEISLKTASKIPQIPKKEEQDEQNDTDDRKGMGNYRGGNTGKSNEDESSYVEEWQIGTKLSTLVHGAAYFTDIPARQPGLQGDKSTVPNGCCRYAYFAIVVIIIVLKMLLSILIFLRQTIPKKSLLKKY
jgi:hypothetical protein